MAILLFLPLQGCSLLFVAKGGTRVSKGTAEKAPEAASLSREMNKPIVTKYKVRPGDSLDDISRLFYGNTSHVGKIAKENRLDRKINLKEGTTLRIIAPAFYPDLSKLPVKVTKKNQAKNQPTPLPTVDPSEIQGMVVEKVARPKVNTAFGPGERLKFEVRALSMLGGYATLEVGDYTKVAGRPCLTLTAHANSVFPLTPIYPVGDVQTSYFDSVDFLTWKFENHIHEGDYRANNLELYDQLKHTMTRKHNEEAAEEKTIAPFSEDLISCFYYFRLLPMQVGKTYAIPTQSSGKNYQLYVRVLSREKVTVPAGTFDCFRLKPIVKEDTVFRNKGEIDLWVTADQRHMPVKVESGIVIGSIDIDLVDATLPSLTKP